uniref:leukocyte surface antigen CD47-like isoform X2 n=1 Tax=Myodes glareolus TaxID=447135 RepID=UPI0020213086|nr:leukocyte surface antigen CD47-like isoform X2 [Myodes glareolus]
MWTLVTTLLLSSLCCGSAQILFKNIESVTVTGCEKNVVIPCHATNMEPEALGDVYLIWFFGKTLILSFDGSKNKYSRNPAFQSGRISTSAFLKGDASLTLNKNEAKAGNYTCAVTELSREGKQTVELKNNHRTSWFPLSENILIIVFPFLTLLLFWAQFAVLMQKYKSNLVNKKMMILSTSGLLFTMVVIVGAFLFIPGNYSKKKSYGLILLVTPSVIPVFLQYRKFMPAIGRTLYAMIMLTVIQALGFALIMSVHQNMAIF